LRGTILARPSPTCAYDDDRLRLPPASPARNSKAGKKESMGRRLSQLCPPYATPSSNSSLHYRRSDARIVENGFATSGGLRESCKVVLVRDVVLDTRGLCDRLVPLAPRAAACIIHIFPSVVVRIDFATRRRATRTSDGPHNGPA